MLRILCITGWLLASTLAMAQDAPSGSAERGRRLFAEFTCNSCHGNLGQGGDLGAGPKIYPNPFPFVAFKAQVRKPRLTMPAYGEKWMKDQDIADIYAYLNAIKPAPPAKDIPLLRD